MANKLVINETPKYNLSVVDGTDLTISLLGPTGPAGLNAITTSTGTDKTGYIYGNGTNIAGATTATSIAVANTLVLRSASTGTTSFNAISATSSSTTGVEATSVTGTGAQSESINGTYHHLFGSTIPSNDRSAVERVRGWFVWFFNSFTGRLKTADITADRNWTLPNASGTIALIDSSQTFSQSQTFSGAFEITNASVKLSAIPTFADNSAASSLATGSVYKTSTGELHIKY